MGDNRRPNRILSCSQEERKKGGRAEMGWEREAKRKMKQKNLTPEDAVNWKIWRKSTDTQ
jgi:hypothetical protein